MTTIMETIQCPRCGKAMETYGMPSTPNWLGCDCAVRIFEDRMEVRLEGHCVGSTDGPTYDTDDGYQGGSGRWLSYFRRSSLAVGDRFQWLGVTYRVTQNEYSHGCPRVPSSTTFVATRVDAAARTSRAG